ncbi:flagellar motor switch protein FliM [Turicibacter sanguinis]|uniref:flagellar motor switch protein FliM n=1 Tax=Turicibacter sanguinis TaxID=154288 RepID=UPI0018AB5121|nr:FliM/FliN family flagellar motor switch protein [Turicibacter sanguinis]MDB8551162.1 FliM/FliN family flagellar motor switch protein [Turicibacter sanguinis]
MMTSNEILRNNRNYGAKSDAERVVRSYDFKETNRFPKECMNILDTIHDNYVRSLASKLSARLGVALNIKIKSISQMTFEEYDVKKRKNMVTFIYEMVPMEGIFCLSLSNEVAFICIDSICGGTLNHKQVAREFTDVEKSLLHLIVSYLLEPISSSWKNYLDIKTQFKTIEVNLENTQYFTPHDLLVSVDIDIEMPWGEKYILNFILPYHSMENQIDNLVSFNKISQKIMEPSPESINLISQQLKQSLINMEVILGRTSLTLSEINHLQVGDVFSIDTKIGELLSIVLEDQEYFRGQLGIKNKKLAIQILEVINNHSEGEV